MTKSARKRKRNEIELEKVWGVSPASDHPLELQPFSPSRRRKGVTLGKLSKIWPAVKHFTPIT